jgi:hypothetical protein
VFWAATTNASQLAAIACWNTAVAYQEDGPGTGPGNILCFSSLNYYTTSTNLTIPTDGQPHMMALIYSNGTITGFLDGTSYSLGSITPEAQNSQDTPTVGAVDLSGTIYYPFDGSIGDVAFIENLTVAQLQNLYAIGSVKYVELDPAAAQSGAVNVTGPMEVVSLRATCLRFIGGGACVNNARRHRLGHRHRHSSDNHPFRRSGVHVVSKLFGCGQSCKRWRVVDRRCSGVGIEFHDQCAEYRRLQLDSYRFLSGLANAL